MTAEERKQMNALCVCIQDEKDYAKFVVLLRELSDLVERKELRFGRGASTRKWQRNRPWRTVSGIVRKILKPVDHAESEKVEISIAEADELFREIRIENLLRNIQGQAVSLNEGAQVDITFEAEMKDTVEERNK